MNTVRLVLRIISTIYRERPYRQQLIAWWALDGLCVLVILGGLWLFVDVLPGLHALWGLLVMAIFVVAGVSLYGAFPYRRHSSSEPLPPRSIRRVIRSEWDGRQRHYRPGWIRTGLRIIGAIYNERPLRYRRISWGFGLCLGIGVMVTGIVIGITDKGVLGPIMGLIVCFCGALVVKLFVSGPPRELFADRAPAVPRPIRTIIADELARRQRVVRATRV
ncbi:hypothetical protein JNJ66_04945 [Candidatus Saccharibacteria bacterium]|nr:hypothetical protein [Candidatus Saccharibacteria bacterium]